MKNTEHIIQDAYGRTIDYLRISLTDRCNLRCRYCMPEDGILSLRHDEILTLEEVYRVAGILTDAGIRRIRLTGGEPLVRKNVMSLVRKLGELPQRPELSLTTNGVMLGEYLDELWAAGVKSVNISLDTRNKETFRELTGVDALDKVEDAIERSLALGMEVKLNTVPIRGINDKELAEIAGMARDKRLSVRFIELMPMGCAGEFEGVSGEEILAVLEKEYGPAEPDISDKIEGSPGAGGSIPDRNKTASENDNTGFTETRFGNKKARGPAEYIHFNGFAGNTGFISPMSHSFCSSCNRVRLTADGRLKLCLYYPDGPELLPAMRKGCSDEELRSLILEGIRFKPEGHSFCSAGIDCNMVRIGG